MKKPIPLLIIALLFAACVKPGHNRGMTRQIETRLENTPFDPEFHVVVADWSQTLPPAQYSVWNAGGFYRVEVGRPDPDQMDPMYYPIAVRLAYDGAADEIADHVEETRELWEDRP